MKLYIDFDHTIFNTDLFQVEIQEIDKNLDLQKDLKKLKEIIKTNNINLEKYLYPDAIPFFKKYKHNYTLILLTKSNDHNAYQLFKIEESKISNYFQEIIIIKTNLKGELDLDYQNSIFIDDDVCELESIKKRNPYDIIRLKRGKHQDEILKTNIKEVTNLLEIEL